MFDSAQEIAAIWITEELDEAISDRLGGHALLLKPRRGGTVRDAGQILIDDVAAGS